MGSLCLVSWASLDESGRAEILVAVVRVSFGRFVEEVVGLVRHEYPLTD
jgi:hypothetical protein